MTMKAIVCELCGSNELIKEDGVFRCMYCGTRYTLEEARKLFSDDSVTVRIDNEELLKNNLVLIETAMSERRYEDAYNSIQESLRFDPNNIMLREKQAMVFYVKSKTTSVPIATEEGMEYVKKALDKENDAIVKRDVSKAIINDLENLKKWFKSQFSDVIYDTSGMRTFQFFYNTWKRYGSKLLCSAQGEINAIYWKEHPDERKEILAKQEKLTKKIDDIDKEIERCKKDEENVPSSTRFMELVEKRDKIWNEVSTIPFYKAKEKKRLENELDLVREQMASITVKIKSEKAPFRSKAKRLTQELFALREEAAENERKLNGNK